MKMVPITTDAISLDESSRIDPIVSLELSQNLASDLRNQKAPSVVKITSQSRTFRSQGNKTPKLYIPSTVSRLLADIISPNFSVVQSSALLFRGYRSQIFVCKCEES
jgi:hypothetical protein